MNDKLLDAIRVDEGLRLKPYKDTAIPPRMTIGYGRNLDDVGISFDEANFLLFNDASKAEKDAMTLVSNWDSLGQVRQNVLTNMTFNMGRGGVSLFKMFLKHVEAGEFDEASEAMKASKWYTQVGKRAIRLANEMRTGLVA